MHLLVWWPLLLAGCGAALLFVLRRPTARPGASSVTTSTAPTSRQIAGAPDLAWERSGDIHSGANGDDGDAEVDDDDDDDGPRGLDLTRTD